MYHQNQNPYLPPQYETVVAPQVVMVQPVGLCPSCQVNATELINKKISKLFSARSFGHESVVSRGSVLHYILPDRHNLSVLAARTTLSGLWLLDWLKSGVEHDLFSGQPMTNFNLSIEHMNINKFCRMLISIFIDSNFTSVDPRWEQRQIISTFISNRSKEESENMSFSAREKPNPREKFNRSSNLRSTIDSNKANAIKSHAEI